SNHVTIELDDTTAQSIVNGLITTLGEWGFTLDFLKANLVAVTTDGASVMVGNVNGVLQRLKDMISPEIITWHCLNHRLELAVGDTVKKVGGGVNHVRDFVDRLYTLYNNSAVLVKELEGMCSDLNVMMKKAILWKHRSASHGKSARRQERAKNNEKYNEALSIEQQGPGLHRASISAPQLSAVRPLRKETVEVAKRRHEVEESQRRIHGDLNAAKTALTLAAGRGRGVAVTPPPGFGPRSGYEAVETFRIGRGTFRPD
ncbi:unnamed protein product, partial [Cyprideis torosa]